MPRLSELKRFIYAILYKLTQNRRYYFYFKWRNINRVLYNDNLLAVFKAGRKLPDNFGIGIDERIVEYPWFFSHLNDGSENILDAGSTFNFWPVISHGKIKNKTLTIMTLAPESKNFPVRNISYIYGDLRSIPLPDDSFGVISCISTIEHVGMDNTKSYTADSRYKENKLGDYLVAVAELRRVLKPGGSLFITVPFGKYQNFGSFQQFNEVMVDKLIANFGGDKHKTTFYKYTKDGWQISSAGECNSAEYTIVEKAKINSLLLVAASAVACLNLTK